MRKYENEKIEANKFDYDGLFTTKDFPSVVCFVNGRLWFANSKEHPYRLWASRPFKYNNFQDVESYKTIDDTSTIEEITDSITNDGKTISYGNGYSYDYTDTKITDIILNSISEENRKLKSENILTTNKFNKKINSLNESIKEKDSVIKDLTSKNSRLNEKLQTLKSSKSTELKALKEELNSKIKEYEKENNSLKEQLTTYKSKLNTSAKLVEKYKGEVKSIKDNYVNAKAQAYGISANEVSKRLSESYEIKDVDSICDEVRDYKTRLKGLPCILNESSNIQVKNSKQNTLKGNSFDDDYVSPSLLGMADID